MRVEPKPIQLWPETGALIREMGRGQELFAPYGLDPDQAAAMLASVTEPMLDGAALPVVTIQQLRWYVRELASLFRARYGFGLSFQLELALRRWAGFGLEPVTMGMVLQAVVNQLRLLPRPLEVMPEPEWSPSAPAEEAEAREAVMPQIRAGPPSPRSEE